VSELEALERNVANLSADALKKFRTWFAEFDAQMWDSQIESDSRNGKLDALVSEALAEHRAGNSREL
jgi:hypothetical protein